MSQNHNSNANNDVKPTIFHDFLGREHTLVPNCAPQAMLPPAVPLLLPHPVPAVPFPALLISVLVGSHLEGVPFYGQRSEFSGSHLMKMRRNVGQEQPMRPILQPGTSGKPDSNPSKWERAIPVNVGPVLQYPLRTGQPVPYPYQPLSNRFKDSTMGTSVISQSAADEGSRTGIKGSGIMNSVNVNGVGEPSTGKQKYGISVPEPGSSTSLRGGSWSTNYLSKLGTKASGGENVRGIGENNTNLPIRDIRRMPLLHGGHRGVIMTDARRPTRPVTEQSTEEKREMSIIGRRIRGVTKDLRPMIIWKNLDATTTEGFMDRVVMEAEVRDGHARSAHQSWTSVAKSIKDVVKDTFGMASI
ncbi:hypothetical protein L2E82_11712 [Cichorium intybus]|uniref:Uncharacterized protein n=1 Tax=Cichorium intybus TaxID=13427 RepID=A0ACB9GF43_CICIN|nr:hypothetical protein L2E82_11712 [Cichorium intybus]